MIGIDIVDLKDKQARMRTEADLRFVLNPDDNPPTLEKSDPKYWWIWAAKEAIFKVRRKLTSFDPKKIKVSFDGHSFDSVDITGEIIQTSDYVLAICSLNNEPITHKIFESSTNDSSSEIRELLNLELSNVGQTAVDSDALPIIVHNNKEYILSFSHHGRFLAYAHQPLP